MDEQENPPLYADSPAEKQSESRASRSEDPQTRPHEVVVSLPEEGSEDCEQQNEKQENQCSNSDNPSLCNISAPGNIITSSSPNLTNTTDDSNADANNNTCYPSSIPGAATVFFRDLRYYVSLKALRSAINASRHVRCFGTTSGFGTASSSKTQWPSQMLATSIADCKALFQRSKQTKAEEAAAAAAAAAAALDLDGSRDNSNDPFGDNLKHLPVLLNVSGLLLPCKLVGLLGPSGAGKSTLLRCLSGLVHPKLLHGEVVVNGVAVTQAQLRQIVGYVDQHDLLYESMTVAEALEMALVLRTKRKLSKAQLHSEVQEALGALGLRHVANRTMGSHGASRLSGGERKRVCIGMEILAQTQVLAVDEPTSGLDARTGLQVVSILRSVADSGRTVIASLHQPSSDLLALLDEVIVLSACGRVVYQGPPGKLREHLELFGQSGCPVNANPADFVLASVLGTCSPTLVRSLADHAAAVAKSPRARRIVELAKGKGKAPGFRHVAPRIDQFWYLMKLFVRLSLRDPFVVRARLANALLQGVLIGCVFYAVATRDVDIRPGVMITGTAYMLAVCVFLENTTAIMTMFSSQRNVFLRNVRSGYHSLGAGFAAKVVAELPVLISAPVVFAVVSGLMMGAKGPVGTGTHTSESHVGLPHFARYIGITAALSLSSSGLGILLGASLSSIDASLALLPAIALPIIIIGGFLAPATSVPPWIAPIQWVSPVHYAYLAYARSHWMGYQPGKGSGDVFLRALEIFAGPPLYASVCALLIIGAVLVLLAYAALRVRAGHEGSLRRASRRHMRPWDSGSECSEDDASEPGSASKAVKARN